MSTSRKPGTFLLSPHSATPLDVNWQALIGKFNFNRDSVLIVCLGMGGFLWSGESGRHLYLPGYRMPFPSTNRGILLSTVICGLGTPK